MVNHSLNSVIERYMYNVYCTLPSKHPWAIEIYMYMPKKWGGQLHGEAICTIYHGNGGWALAWKWVLTWETTVNTSR